MNSSTLPASIAPHASTPPGRCQALVDPPTRTLRLPAVAGAAEPVRLLQCPELGLTELRVRQGRVWLTREGRPEDLFLDAGDCCCVSGAARLHLSAENGQDAWLEIRLRRG